MISLYRIISLSVLAITAAAVLTACASSKTDIVMPNSAPSSGPVKTIAMLPGGVLADALSIHLVSHGFAVFPTPETVTESSTLTEEGRSPLKDLGADALLVVRSSTDKDGRPRSASALLYDVKNGGMLVGVTWENGHGFGMERSVSNEAMRVGHDQAAREIAAKLASVIPR